MIEPNPNGTGVPMQMTGVEEWFDDLRAVWADKTTSTLVKIQRTLTNTVIMLAIFVLVGLVALIVMKLKSKCPPCGIETTETPAATSTEI
jgi:hypothetical protein